MQLCIEIYLKSVEHVRCIEPIRITFKKIKVMSHISITLMTKFHPILMTSFEARTRAKAKQIADMLFVSSIISLSCHLIT